MTAGNYSFADGDRLEDRNTYFYTPFGGEAFLEAWRNQRENALAALPQPSAPEGPLGGELPRTPPVNTETLLKGLLGALAQDKAETPAVRDWLQKLVKKFEVNKRIHPEYDVQFRAVDRTAHSDLRLYILLAEVFELAHRRTKDLTFLNAFLKCLDTLCSVKERLPEQSRARLAWLIRQEGGHVRALADTLS